MSNFKQAVKQKLRVQTNKGLLSVEQLNDLSITDLDTLAVGLEEAYNNSKGKSFLSKKTTKDKDIKLAFDIVLELLEDKVSEQEMIREKAETKEHNQKILKMIEDKKDEELAGKSIKQLTAMLKD